MSVVINTNSAATQSANNLSSSNAMLQKSLARLSSGSKIVNPADDEHAAFRTARDHPGRRRFGEHAAVARSAVVPASHAEDFSNLVDTAVLFASEPAPAGTSTLIARG